MKTRLLPALLIFLTGFVSFTIQASPSISALPYIKLAQNDSQSLEAATQSIKEQTGGRILSAKTIIRDGRQIHKIKVLLPSGKVRIFNVNAN